jgi:hypothetical protein
LTRIPILDATVPYRYGLYVALAAAVVLAIGLDRLRDELQHRRATASNRYAMPAILIAVLVPLVPVFPYSVMTVRTPEYFRSAAVSAIPSGSVVVTYPFAGPWSAETMVWQARNDFRYRMVGGYQNLPDGHGGFTHLGNLSVTRTLLDDLFFERSTPEVTPTLRQAVLDDLRGWDAGTVVVDLGVPGSSAALALFTEVLGRPPLHQEGVAIWYALPFARVQ